MFYLFFKGAGISKELNSDKDLVVEFSSMFHCL